MEKKRESAPQNLRRKDPKNEQRTRNNQRHKRRRKRGRAVFAALVLLFIVAVVVTLSLTVFFKTEKIEIVGETQYSNEEIIACTGIRLGDNLFGISAKNIQNRILQSFGGIDTAQVIKNLPGTLTIKLTTAVPTFVFESGGSYYTVSQSCRILNTEATQSQGIPLITGAEIEGSLVQGDTLILKNAAVKEYIDTVIGQCTQYGLTDLMGIDVSNPTDIRANYGNRITVRFGDSTQLQYKAQLAFHVIKNNILSVERGTVDATKIGEVHFQPARS